MNQVIDEPTSSTSAPALEVPGPGRFRQYESRLASMLQATVEEVLHRQGHDARRSDTPHPASVLSEHLAAGFDVRDWRVPDDPPASWIARLEGDAQHLTRHGGGDREAVPHPGLALLLDGHPQPSLIDGGDVHRNGLGPEGHGEEEGHEAHDREDLPVSEMAKGVHKSTPGS